MKDCTWKCRRVNSQKSTVHVRAISSPTFHRCDRISSTRSRWQSYFTTLTSQRSHYLKATEYRERARRCDQLKCIKGNFSRMWSSWMPSWLQSWLSYLGLFNKRGRLVRIWKSFSINLNPSQSFSINLNPSQAFLGLDNAGKTSLVQMLSTGVIHQVFFPKVKIRKMFTLRFSECSHHAPDHRWGKLRLQNLN